MAGGSRRRGYWGGGQGGRIQARYAAPHRRVTETEKVLRLYNSPHAPPSIRVSTMHNGGGGEATGGGGSPSPSGRTGGAQGRRPGMARRPRPDVFRGRKMRGCVGYRSRCIWGAGRSIRDVAEADLPTPATARRAINTHECVGCGRRGTYTKTGLWRGHAGRPCACRARRQLPGSRAARDERLRDVPRRASGVGEHRPRRAGRGGRQPGRPLHRHPGDPAARRRSAREQDVVLPERGGRPGMDLRGSWSRRRMPCARRPRARASPQGRVLRVAAFLSGPGGAALGSLRFVPDLRIPPTNVPACATTWKNAGMDYVIEVRGHA